MRKVYDEMRSNKQGSALLIVLGFLSFMVVSAVAFAIYMRAERMPSSALRRAVATRHLVKAALAEAISRVDDAVRDDPFPGLCATNNNGTVLDTSKFYYFRSGKGGEQAIDVWDGRVFMPPDPQGGTIDAETRYAPVSETVSVLTLEGLGYLPPPLVNDVRFLSRSSWAASWQPLPFDSGRFAYCAVNVSDFLDVNRVSADKPRTSEAQRRLSVAHLFDRNFDPYDLFGNNNVNGSSVENPDGAAKAFDDFSGKRAGALRSGYVQGENVGGKYESWDAIGDKAPYVSMMDYNLALASAGPNSYLTPLYYNWLANKRKDQSYYIQSSSRSSEMYAALRQPFVTDSWSTNENWVVDISQTEGQPFKGMQSQLKRTNGKTSFGEVMRAQANKFFIQMENPAQLIGEIDYAMLYDYLDHDDIPLSLALPCVERVPMIAGLTPPQLTLSKFDSTGEPDKGGKTWRFDARQWFDDSKEMHIVVPFPFKHGKDRGDSRNFSAQVLVRMVLAPASATKETLANAVRPGKEQWETQGPGRRMDGSVFSFTCLSKQKQFTVPEDVVDDTDAHISGGGGVDFTFGDFPNNLSQVDVLRQETIADGEPGPDGVQKKKDVYTVLCSPLDENGKEVVAVGQQIEEAAFNGISGIEFVPHVFVWARILNSQGKTVDLVPAGLYDDQDLGERSVDPDFALLEGLTGQMSPTAKPLFEFVSTDPATAISFAKIKDGSFTGGDVIWNVKGIYAVDPRYNYAPEHWYDAQTDNITFSDWLNKTKSALQDGSMADRDPDIFMFVSNQGFLQSIGEFGFLPFLHEPGTAASFNFTAINPHGMGAFGTTALEVMKRYQYLWRTYDARDFYERAEAAGIGCSRQKENLVNPHTDNLGVMMAALANTPYDYWATAAGVDHSECQLFKDLGDDNFDGFTKFSDAKDYAFNSRNTGSKIQYRELVQIAKTIMSAMGGVSLQDSDEAVAAAADALGGVNRSNLRNEVVRLLKEKIRAGAVRPSNAWRFIWDKLWDELAFNSVDPKDTGSFEELLGVPLSEPLHSIDRKFLYSYWRDCFANNQQLFLIFVRAESSALGGPGEGTPAQLGGRAVALVWRDPDWSEGDGDNGRDRDFESQNTGNLNRQRPHRTRVLFYHQFD